MKKRFTYCLAVLLIFAMLFTLTGCGAGQDSDTQSAGGNNELVFLLEQKFRA